ncbi:MAG: 50S ribosomal protein L21e [Pyrobaculum sp.]
MVKRTHGYRYKSRKLLSKTPRERGPRGLSRLLYEYNPGDRVVVDIDPTYISTAPHRRYQGKVGVVVETRGRAYVIETYLGDKKKVVITTPEHLRPHQGGS